MPKQLIHTLILEDDLETLSKIFSLLAQLEEKMQAEFSTLVVSESPQVESLINRSPDLQFDLILLDRDCKVGGSFHNLNITRFGVDKVIAISSVPAYNESLREKGVSRIVPKDYRELDDFINRLSVAIEATIARR